MLVFGFIILAVFVVRSKEATSENFFFGGRNVQWYILGPAFISTWWINSFVLLPHYEMVIMYAISSFFIILFMATYGANIFLFNGSETIGDFFEKRSGNRTTRYFVATLNLLLSIVLRLTLVLMVGNVILTYVLGFDAYQVLLVLLVTVGLYIVVGGMGAELYAQAVHSVVLLLIGCIGVFHALSDTSMLQLLPHYAVIQPFIPKGVLLPTSIGVVILAVWTWLVDTMNIQKLLCAGSLRTVRKSSFVALLVLAVVSVVLCVTVFALPSWHVLRGGEVKPLSTFLRVGIFLGVVVTIMGTWAALFNSVSLSVTYDFFKTQQQSSSGRTLVLVGRVTTIVLMVFSIIVMPFILSFSALHYGVIVSVLFQCAGVLAGMFVSVFVLRGVPDENLLLGGWFGVGSIVLRFVVLLFGGYSIDERVFNIDGYEFSVVVFFITLGVCYVTHKLQRKRTVTNLHTKEL